MRAESESDAFLRQISGAARKALRPSNAVAALLVHENGGYIMQLRDSKEGIFYPGHWGCFGGAVEQGEDAVSALRRELQEEIEFEMKAATQFTQFDFDFRSLGHGKVYRVYFEVVVPDSAYRRFVLHEGTDLKAFDANDLLVSRRVTPYDAFAVWMHAHHARTGA